MLLLRSPGYLLFPGLAACLTVGPRVCASETVWSLGAAVNACMHKHRAALMSGPRVYSTFEDSQVR